MEIQGKIIMDIPEVSGVSKAGNTWRKKEWVLETQGQYPRQVKFDFFGDRINNNHLQVGKTYIISFDLESRQFNERWYTDVRAFASREVMEGPTVQEPVSPTFGPAPATSGPVDLGAPAGESSDDLPF